MASWYSSVLGYKRLLTFKANIEEAKRTCSLLNIDVNKNFIPFKNGRRSDYKLSKFACFLLALHADGRKPMVKRARAYFLEKLEGMNALLKDEGFLHRLIARDEVKRLNVKLNKTARRAHVKDFRFFANAGYLGLYNNTMPELKILRNVTIEENLYDYMSMTELAANMFRISLTDEKLKSLRNPTQERAALEHQRIASQIRNIINSNLGKNPESLPNAQDLAVIEKRLKETKKIMNKPVKVLPISEG
jgi:DNA-damage-inducible protein D